MKITKEIKNRVKEEIAEIHEDMELHRNDFLDKDWSIVKNDADHFTVKFFTDKKNSVLTNDVAYALTRIDWAMGDVLGPDFETYVYLDEKNRFQILCYDDYDGFELVFPKEWFDKRNRDDFDNLQHDIADACLDYKTLKLQKNMFLQVMKEN